MKRLEVLRGWRERWRTPVAAPILRQLASALVGHLDHDHPRRPQIASEVGFAIAMAQLLGAACVRHITAIPPVCDLTLDELVAQLAPTIQRHLVGT